MPSSFESRVRAASVGFALAALGTASVVHAQSVPKVIYVDASASIGGNGQSWNTAIRDLQDALAIANVDAMRATRPVEIHIAQGIYLPNRGIGSPQAPFVVASAVSLLGGFGGVASAQPNTQDPSRFVSVLSGDLLQNDGLNFTNREENAQSLVNVMGTGTSLDGLTLRGCRGETLKMLPFASTLSRCRIVDNTGSGFSGYSQGSLNIWNCVISDCEFSDNQTHNMAVVSLTQCSVLRCTFAGNRVTHQSAASVTDPGTLYLSGASSLVSCAFLANTSDTAGAVSGGSPTIFFNCTFADNRAVLGPAMRANSSTQAWNCIFARNLATGSFPPHQISTDTTWGLTVPSSLIVGGVGDVLASGPYSGTGFITGDPGFVNPSGPDGDPLTWRDNDYRLMPTSRCVDTGTSTPLLYYLNYLDITGHVPVDAPSVQNRGSGYFTFLDLGCYEYIPNPCRADFNNSGTLSPQDIFDFLGGWFALSPSADFNTSGTISPQDIFDFLGAWFAGC